MLRFKGSFEATHAKNCFHAFTCSSFWARRLIARDALLCRKSLRPRGRVPETRPRMCIDIISTSAYFQMYPADIDRITMSMFVCSALSSFNTKQSRPGNRTSEWRLPVVPLTVEVSRTSDRINTTNLDEILNLFGLKQWPEGASTREWTWKAGVETWRCFADENQWQEQLNKTW